MHCSTENRKKSFTTKTAATTAKWIPLVSLFSVQLNRIWCLVKQLLEVIKTHRFWCCSLLDWLFGFLAPEIRSSTVNKMQIVKSGAYTLFCGGTSRVYVLFPNLFKETWIFSTCLSFLCFVVGIGSRLRQRKILLFSTMICRPYPAVQDSKLQLFHRSAMTSLASFYDY